MKLTKAARRQRIRYRIRRRIAGTAERPRISVYRSNKAIYAQLINDQLGHTLASANSLDASIDRSLGKIEQAKAVGQLLAERAKAAGYEAVLFDRGGYLYHGRVKALADGAREAGLAF